MMTDKDQPERLASSLGYLDDHTADQQTRVTDTTGTIDGRLLAQACTGLCLSSQQA